MLVTAEKIRNGRCLDRKELGHATTFDEAHDLIEGAAEESHGVGAEHVEYWDDFRACIRLDDCIIQYEVHE